ncbi:MAG TPA: MFS transporter [Nitrospiraceae bacterium]|nr:MFS transporter [Nitrospiraceae bacterium]
MIPRQQDAPPTRIRWRMAALLFSISVVTYIDRVNISVTARQMMPALGLTDVQMGQVFSAFVFGYAICQIPGGWLGDQWGARRVLTLAVIWWSLFTALTAVAAILPVTALVGVLGGLILIRFLVGVGEAAALPNFNRTVANWLAPHERGLGIGIAIGGIGIGSAVTPPITAWIMVNFGWQTAFYAASVLGLIIAAVWYLYATDRPSDHPHVNAAEVALIKGSSGHGVREKAATSTAPPWRRFARTPTIWWLVLSYSCLGYIAAFYLFWFYLYLVNVAGFSVLRGAFFASSPFVAITLFCPLGGWVTDWLATKRGINTGRTSVGMAGMLLASLSIVFGAISEVPWVAITLLSLGAGWLYFTVGAYWASTVDLSKTHAGTLSGLMNTGANLGGSLSPTLTPWLADHVGWPAALTAAAAIAMVGGLMWMKIKPGNGLAAVPSRKGIVDA